MNAGNIKKMAVIGTGTMGPGMGFCFAGAGIETVLYDISPDQVGRAERRIKDIGRLYSEEGLLPADRVEAALDRIKLTTDLAEAVGGAQFVLEAAPEKMEVKHQVFPELEKLAPAEAVLATNTSGLSVTEIGSSLKNPARIVGMHWVNPPELVPLVEVIKAEQTPDELMNLTYDLAVRIGKKPIRVGRDLPGFAMNRLQFALLREALDLVESGVLSPEDVDRAFKYGHGFRTSWQGPLQTADLGGLDIFHAVAAYLFTDLAATKEPPRVLADRVAAGDLGLKTGRGFYEWTDQAKEMVRKRDIYFARQWKLINQVKAQ